MRHQEKEGKSVEEKSDELQNEESCKQCRREIQAHTAPLH